MARLKAKARGFRAGLGVGIGTSEKTHPQSRLEESLAANPLENYG
jgi:hypothetical protein